MIKGFKEFVTRGNAIEMAVGIVLGLAFKAVIDAVIAGFVSPLIAAIFGKPDLTALWHFAIGDGKFNLGIILQSLFTFLTVALALYFVVVMPLNKLAELRKRGEVAEEAGPTEIELLTEIRDSLKK